MTEDDPASHVGPSMENSTQKARFKSLATTVFVTFRRNASCRPREPLPYREKNEKKSPSLVQLLRVAEPLFVSEPRCAPSVIPARSCVATNTRDRDIARCLTRALLKKFARVRESNERRTPSQPPRARGSSRPHFYLARELRIARSFARASTELRTRVRSRETRWRSRCTTRRSPRRAPRPR